MIAFMGRRGTRDQIRLSAGFAGMAFGLGGHMLSLLILEFVVEVNLVCLTSRDLFSRVEGVVCVARGLVDRLKSARFFGYRAGYRGLSRVIDLEICSFVGSALSLFLALLLFLANF